MLIQGKVALITGAARGLGKHFATELLRKGAAGVCLVDFRDKLLTESTSELQTQFGKGRVCLQLADVTVQSQLEAAFGSVVKQFGKLHIVCNNAGIADELNPDKTFAVNLVAVYRGTMLGIRHMRRDTPGGEGGVIVNVSSMAGFNAATAAPVYTATKHGVLGLSRATGNAHRFKNEGIRVNCLCPGFTDTDMVRPLLNPELRKDPLFKDAAEYLHSMPLIRPEVVTEGFIQLVEDESKNGEVLSVLPNIGLLYKKYPADSRL